MEVDWVWDMSVGVGGEYTRERAKAVHDSLLFAESDSDSGCDVMERARLSSDTELETNLKRQGGCVSHCPPRRWRMGNHLEI